MRRWQVASNRNYGCQSGWPNRFDKIRFVLVVVDLRMSARVDVILLPQDLDQDIANFCFSSEVRILESAPNSS